MLECGVATVHELHLYELVKFILTSICLSHSAPMLNQILTLDSETSYMLRVPSQTKAVVPFVKSKIGEHSLACRVPRLYNKLKNWGVLQSQSDIALLSNDSLKSLGHELFDNYIMGNEDVVRSVFGLLT